MPRRRRHRWYWLGAFLFVASVVTLGYATYSGWVVSQKMNELKWDLPSRVYASPILIYPGARLLESDLRGHLGRLGYRETRRERIESGQWRKAGGRFEIGVRAYRGPAAAYPATLLKLWVSNGNVTSMRASVEGAPEADVFTATLEPERIGEFFRSDREDRTIVRIADVPRTLKEAILVMEDRSFESHFGVSFRGMARAFWSNLRGGKVTQGGSTLTQQLVKNFFLTPERTLRRKLRELIMTLVLEGLYSKNEILEAYINEIYLGQRGSTSIHGFGEAARFYFSKPIQSLTLGEQAMLAGMIRSPGFYSPYEHPEAAKARRDLVLKLLLEQKKIGEELYTAAIASPLEPRGRAGESYRAPYFVDFIRHEVAERFSQASLATQGYEIHTTLDPLLQELALKAVKEGLVALEASAKKRKIKPAAGRVLQAALVAVQPQSGAIKAMIGGREWGETQYNRAVAASRQVGSAIKPFVAAVALSPVGEGGKPSADPATHLEDKPTTFVYSGRDWAPKNYEEFYAGETTVRGALERSLNVATVNLAIRIGMDRLVGGLRKFGFSDATALPSIVLGSIQASPLGLARSYTAFANGGLLADPHGVAAVISQNGERYQQRSTQVEPAIDPRVAFLVTHLLRGAVQRGTARAVSMSGLTSPLAGKTGTTQDYRDSWFVGYSPTLLTVVWVGHDDDTTTGLTGASGALPIWLRFMREALKRSTLEEFQEPEGIEWVEIDRLGGCRGGEGEKLREAFLEGTEVPKCQ